MHSLCFFLAIAIALSACDQAPREEDLRTPTSVESRSGTDDLEKLSSDGEKSRGSGNSNDSGSAPTKGNGDGIVPPFSILTPRAGRTAAPTDQLTWSPLVEGAVFSVIIANDKQCEEPVKARSGLEKFFIDLQDLPTGRYFACLAAEAGNAKRTAENSPWPIKVDADLVRVGLKSPVPSPTNKTSVDLALTGDRFERYRYKFAKDARGCDSADGYGEPRDFNQRIKHDKLPEGTTTLCVKGTTDQGGQVVSDFSWEIDLTPPDRPSPLLEQSVVGPAFQLSWTSVSEALEYRVGRQEDGRCLIHRTTKNQFHFTDQPGGEQTYCLAAMDRAGNLSEPRKIDLTVRTSGPVVSLADLPAGPTNSTEFAVRVMGEADFEYRYALTKGPEGNASEAPACSTVDKWSSWNDPEKPITDVVPVPIDEGVGRLPVRLCVEARDEFGNYSPEIAQHSWVLDQVPPDTNGVSFSGIENLKVNDLGAIGWDRPEGAVTFDLTVGRGNSCTDVLEKMTGFTETSIDYMFPESGQYSLCLDAIDAAGNKASVTPVTFTVAPPAFCGAPKFQEVDPDEQGISKSKVDMYRIMRAYRSPDGSYFVLGYRYGGSLEDYPSVVAKLTPDKELDPNFGTNGRYEIEIFNRDEQAVAITSDPTGKLVVAGLYAPYYEPLHMIFYIMRLNPDGTLDTTFNPDGEIPGVVKQSSTSQTAKIGEVATDENGTIILGGALHTGANNDATVHVYSKAGDYSGGEILKNLPAKADDSSVADYNDKVNDVKTDSHCRTLITGYSHYMLGSYPDYLDRIASAFVGRGHIEYEGDSPVGIKLEKDFGDQTGEPGVMVYDTDDDLTTEHTAGQKVSELDDGRIRMQFYDLNGNEGNAYYDEQGSLLD